MRGNTIFEANVKWDRLPDNLATPAEQKEAATWAATLPTDLVHPEVKAGLTGQPWDCEHCDVVRACHEHLRQTHRHLKEICNVTVRRRAQSHDTIHNVLDFVTAHPGCSNADVRTELYLSDSCTRNALIRLRKLGKVTTVGTNVHMRYFLAAPAALKEQAIDGAGDG